jgi:hypothetical protein
MRRVTLAVFLVVCAACTSGSGSGNDGGVTDSGPSPSPTVPNVVGQTLDHAQASVTPVVTIAQKGTTLSSDDPADTIVRQTPAAGTTYDPIDGVRVRVVITVVPVQVPGVVGLSLDNAKKQLASRGLKISVWKVQSTQAEDVVLAQGVHANKAVARGTRVRIKVVHPHVCGDPLNPWCYSVTSGGSVIYNPPGTLCNFLNCISSFWSYTNGYVEQCANGEFSHSGGVQGSCSQQGGNWRPLYA